MGIYHTKGIYHDLGNTKIKGETISNIRLVIKNLKRSKAILTPDQLVNIITNTVYTSGSKADILYIENSSSLVVKKEGIHYSWNIVDLITPPAL